ncbi:MAG: S1 RNA-binding domain-containing protein [Candidatus Sumerlaeales bacterium]|nr:S1 RNA-binding domain-containing protein [Candidatus Sumerlaeales bacterium]
MHSDINASNLPGGNEESKIDTSTSSDEIGHDEMAEFDKAMSEGVVEVPDLNIGQLVDAKVIDVKKDYVLLDIGDKAEGVVETREFSDIHDNIDVKAGDTVSVVLVGRDSETGQLKLSRRQARLASEKERLKGIFKANQTVVGRVKKAVKEGLIVDIGLDAFLHRSQIESGKVDREAPLDKWVGEEITAFITSIAPDSRDEKRTKISISRRRYLDSVAEEKAAEIMASLEIDSIITAKVKQFAKFGVFVDLGGIDGLVPMSEIAWERGAKAEDVLKLGYSYKFKVIAVETREDEKGRKNRRITLSRKQIKPDPWLKIQEVYPLDTTVNVTITGLAYNCAYASLDDFTDGVIPREELSWGTSLKNVSDVLKKGTKVDCKVIGYNDVKHQLRLSFRAITQDPWDTIEERFPVNTKHKGKVLETLDYGAFVELDEFTKGLVHHSDFSYDRQKRIVPSEILKVGDEIEVVVLNIEKQQRRINLGIKQINGDPFKQYIADHKEKSTVTGTVSEIVDSGARILLAENVLGFLRIKDWDMTRTETLKGILNVGDSVTALISNIDRKKRDISLSRRDYLREEEKKDREAYSGQKTEKAVTNLGNLMENLNFDLPKEN